MSLLILPYVKDLVLYFSLYLCTHCTSPDSYRDGEGAVLHCKARLLVLPHQLSNIADHRIVDDLLVLMLIEDLLPGLSSPLERRLRGEA